jgi:hypothetical protein
MLSERKPAVLSTANASRIAKIGISPTELTARATRVVGKWQRSSRLDLLGLDERSILRPENLPATRGARRA